ncbi:hypothetical protein AAIH46_20145 [Rhizobium sp. 0TCS1.26]|uniref:hypothetical protein n=1 Tax=Rhizobium sp. 0TCS1.26 TaxID=3142623 RepID=UPI003D267E1C
MNAVVAISPPAPTREWLTSRTFDFVIEPHDITVSRTFLFHASGSVAGYSHPNERFWDIDGETVRILDHNGRPTCVMKTRLAEGGRLQLAGTYCGPLPNEGDPRSTHVLRENASDDHGKIQSFDLFDTLVARRCYDPLEVFRAVEVKSGVAGFAERRHLVEMSIFGRQDYGLDDIYASLVAEGLVTEATAGMLCMMELEEEWDTLFPIQEVVAFVNPGDIIISDMYLPYEFVQRILKEKCGLENELYLSNYGKHQRKIWPDVMAKHAIRCHYGDNLHADVVGASEVGIQPMYVSISKWSATETILHQAGLSAYAHAVRRLRLGIHHREPQIANALKAQASINIPLMILGSLWIRQLAATFEADRILTCARDCNLWHEMLVSSHFARTGMPHARYLKISRTLCHDGREEFEAYLRSNMGERNLLVDMVGTGQSLNSLVDRLDLRGRLRPCILVADPVAARNPAALDFLLLKDFMGYRLFIEALNASLDGSAAAAVFDHQGLRIVTQPNEFGPLMQRIITLSRNLFGEFLVDLDGVLPPKEMPSIDTLQAAAEGIVAQLPEQVMKLQPIWSEQGKNLARTNLIAAE